MHPFFHRTRPLAFAHRGGSGLAPENTIPAFDNGLALGADGLELDVRFSRDAVVVVHHDDTLDRTTDARGGVHLLTAAELERVDAAYRFARDGSFPLRGCGIGVPSLAAVLERYRDCRLIVELKIDRPELGHAVVDVVRRADAVDRVCLGSFGLRVLQAARALEPAMATSAATHEVRWALYRSRLRWPVTRAVYQGFQVPETRGTTRVVSSRFVRDAHGAGLGVQVWTVDREEDARRLLGWDVDALISDRPDVIVPLLREMP